MNTMYKWGLITFGIGMALVALDIYLAAKKPQGIEPQDKVRIKGIVWLSIFGAGFVMLLIWMSD